MYTFFKILQETETFFLYFHNNISVIVRENVENNGKELIGKTTKNFSTVLRYPIYHLLFWKRAKRCILFLSSSFVFKSMWVWNYNLGSSHESQAPSLSNKLQHWIQCLLLGKMKTKHKRSIVSAIHPIALQSACDWWSPRSRMSNTIILMFCLVGPQNISHTIELEYTLSTGVFHSQFYILHGKHAFFF